MHQTESNPSINCRHVLAASDKHVQFRTADEVWAQLRAGGLSANEWAKQHGFEPTLVYSVLSGNRKCLRGKSHEIAKALGLK
jgi:gp16 family phage-associated protein